MSNRIMQIVISGCALFLLLAMFPMEVHAIILADGGRSNYSIVLADDASPSEIHGAKELQTFFEMISGAYLPLYRANEDIPGSMILVGNSSKLRSVDSNIDFDNLGTDGFVIKTAGSHLILAGSKVRGSMYAVYTFLEEKLGCRWYTSQVSRIPQLSTVTLQNIDEIHIPAFESRNPFWYDAFDGDWSARNRCNGSSARLDDDRGGKIIYQGGHTFDMFIPASGYFENHPEYFSIVKGRRVFEHYQAQLCLNNPEVIGITKDKLYKWMKNSPDAYIFGVGQNDGFAGECECRICKPIDIREESPSGNVIYFVNKVAEYVEKDFPDKKVGTFAYNYTVKPPKYARPRGNVNIRLCHMSDIEGCDAHPVEDCSHNANFANYVRGWHEIADHIYIWDYKTNFQHYMMPKPSFFATQKDLQFFKRNGVDGIMNQGAYQFHNGASAELSAYLEAKLMWDPDRDVKMIMDDFLEGYYGPAAPAIRKYYDLLYNKTFGEWMHFPINPRPYAEYLSPGLLTKLDVCLQEAAKLAKGKPEIEYRVEAARLWVQYAELNKPAEHIAENGLYKPADEDRAKKSLLALNDFVETCRRHTITGLQEYGTHREKMMRANFSTNRIVTLENDLLKVDVVPGLGGRILQICDKGSGRNMLRTSKINARYYPAPTGYSDGILSFDALDHRIEKTSDGIRLIMSGTGNAPTVYSPNDNSLYCEKVIFLDAEKASLTFTTKIENRGNSGKGLKITPTPQFDVGNCADIQIGYKTESGNYEVFPLIGTDGEGEVRKEYWKAAIPSDTWILMNKAQNTGIMSIAHRDELEGYILSGSSENNSLSLSLQGIFGTLRGGETRTLSHTYTIINDVSEYCK